MRLTVLYRKLGPGFITGASDDDPSGIATYSQTGAQFGYSQLWTAPFSFPFMAAIQEMVGRIGLVTGRGLSAIIKEHYSKKILYFSVGLLLVANTVNIGADLGAMAASAQLLFGLPFVVWLFGITIFTALLEVFVSYQVYARFLKYLTFSLFAYFVTAFVVKQDWSAALFATLVPHLVFTEQYMLNIVAILGTTISPYLFFWQASEEVEEEIAHHKLAVMGQGKPRVNHKDIRDMRLDTIVGMFFSNLVMYFIILTAASTLGTHGITEVATASAAAEALRPLAGDFTFFLFALGIIGTGLLAVPILAGSASYAVAEALGWRSGLYRRLVQAHGFYGVIALATLAGLLVNFLSVPPFKMLYYTAVLNGIIAPPLLVLIMLIANRHDIMGRHINSPLSNIMGWTATGLMTAAALALIIMMVF
ncbi:iron transporter [Candidatus Uhrbacteria bacterium RIFCSPLOWO2_02_FULL_48_12]|uniref:Iron transporter n=1 Tax=Candidatus Uhrbacteria bacterium RIFCSPLOWO2_02_FULL_48_12 TaxID=1802407 RepID=A0A1F7VA90_9BACT|nr:MAG: iron transporter [Candidatus Uhrbacteria bacterium RIFCSPLOWO2_02_FULL_48_12]